MSETKTTIVTAAWVAPMDVPVIRDGAVAVRGGRIVCVGPRADVVTAWRGAVVEEWGQVLVTPGLVNAHTHLELSACECGEPPVDFAEWIMTMGPRLEAVAPGDRERAFRMGTERGIAECLKFGVTTIGDISQQYHLTRPIIAGSAIRCVSFGEAIGLAKRRERFEALLAGAIDTGGAGGRLRVGLTPHAPYTVDEAGYEQCLAIAKRLGLPLATHLAETTEETTFLATHGGRFRDVWEFLQSWEDGVVTLAAPPIRGAKAIGLIDHPTLLAHVNYCDDEELGMLARGRASVVYCPRTHQYFRHPPHRWREMLAAGVNVSVGTDSCASSPNLNLLDDLRLMHRIAPEFPIGELWRMGTVRGATALGMDAEVGSLAAGKHADLVAFQVTTETPLTEVLERSVLPEVVRFSGDAATASEP